jgi:MFS family permease
MAYDNSPYRRHEPDVTDSIGLPDRPRYRGETGFREEGELRAGAGAQQSVSPYQTGYASGGYGETERTPTVPAAVLDDVFDDPDHGEPGRDRLAVHWVWEVLLLLGVAGLGYLLWTADRAVLTGAGLSSLLTFAAAIGLLGTAAAMTLRTAAPNLAIGPLAVASGVYFAQRGADGVEVPAAYALLAALALGLATALFVVVFHVPGWAASVVAALVVIVWIQQQGSEPVPLSGSYDPTSQATLLFAVVAAISVLGGLLGTLKGVRRSVGRFRPVADPARRRGGVAALVTGAAIVVSMLFAVIAGVLLAAGSGQPVVPGEGLYLTGLGFGVALLGGASAFGRRGGVFGTILAVAAVALFIDYQATQDWRISRVAIAAGVIAAGLVVTRLIETFGRPRSAEVADDDEWEDTGAAESTGLAGVRVLDRTGDTRFGAGAANGTGAGAPAGQAWSNTPSDTWSSALPAQPAQPAAGRTDPWEDDRWRNR